MARKLVRTGRVRKLPGQQRPKGMVEVAEVDLGRDKLFAIGPEVTQRTQRSASFKLLFNGIFYGPASATGR